MNNVAKHFLAIFAVFALAVVVPVLSPAFSDPSGVGIGIGIDCASARATTVKGKCEYQCNGEWETINRGDEFPAGTIIQTGFNSYCDFKIGKCVVSVAPLTRMKISELAADSSKQTVVLHLDTGKLNNNVQSPKRNLGMDYRVKTPACTASVRGTKFSITADGEVEELDKGGDHTVFVLDHATGKETAIHPGEHISVKIDPERRDETSRTTPMKPTTIQTEVEENVGNTQNMTGITITATRQE